MKFTLVLGIALLFSCGGTKSDNLEWRVSVELRLDELETNIQTAADLLLTINGSINRLRAELKQVEEDRAVSVEGINTLILKNFNHFADSHIEQYKQILELQGLVDQIDSLESTDDAIKRKVDSLQKLIENLAR